MKTIVLITASIFLAFAVFAGGAMAFSTYSYGNEITVPDLVANSTYSPPAVNASGTAGEDDETERDASTGTNTVTGQAWDLEGFFTQPEDLNNNGTNDITDQYWLHLVSGYDIANGQSNGSTTFTSGDIFVRLITDTSEAWSPPSLGQTGSNPDLKPATDYNYDWVIDLMKDDPAGSGTLGGYGTGANQVGIYNVNSATNAELVYYAQFDHSDPWKLYEGSSAVIYGFGLTTADHVYSANESDLSMSMWEQTGDSHKVLSVDINNIVWTVENLILDDNQEATLLFHYTYECGNDLLIGQLDVVGSQGSTPQVPIPGAFWLLTSGMIPFILFRRKRK